jgi:hypothetical protein
MPKLACHLARFTTEIKPFVEYSNWEKMLRSRNSTAVAGPAYTGQDLMCKPSTVHPAESARARDTMINEVIVVGWTAERSGVERVLASYLSDGGND